MKGLFPLGQILITRGAEAALSELPVSHYLLRHGSGDWGVMPDKDKAQNDSAVSAFARLHSAYPIDPTQPCDGITNTVWVITEADRSVTTLLLPDEY